MKSCSHWTLMSVGISLLLFVVLLRPARGETLKKPNWNPTQDAHVSRDGGRAFTKNKMHAGFISPMQVQALKKPNRGLNTQMFMLGLSWFF